MWLSTGLCTCSGCKGQGELVFVIDAVNHNDQQTFTASQNFIKEVIKRNYNDKQTFTASQNFIKDVIKRIANCIQPDGVRLGFIYCTESDDQQFGLRGFQSSIDAIAVIGTATI